jgi:hypothetical protein
MSFWELLLIILGSVFGALALISGFVYIITRNHKKPMFPSHKQRNMTSSGKLRSTNGLKVSTRLKMAKSEDTLEILLKNHKKAEINNNRVQTAGIRTLPAVSEPVENKTNIAGAARRASAETAMTQKSRPARVSGAFPPDIADRKIGPENTAVSISDRNYKYRELVTNTFYVESKKTQARFMESKIYKELELNFKIAKTLGTGTLVPFQTNSWDSEQANHIEPEFEEMRNEISEAYVDIRLANSVIWLSNEVGQRSSDLDKGYGQLCGKIAGQLKQILSSLNDRKQS